MRFSIAGVVGLSLLLAGCSADANRPKVAPVSGKVTHKGQPLTAGDVIFTPTGGAASHIATGQIGPDGSYQLTTFNTGDGAVLGTHKVTVTARSAEDLKKLNEPKGGRIAYKLPAPLTPPKYSKVESTPLQYTVDDKRNTIDIDLLD